MWKFDSLPHERTRITVELAISENFTVGVPSFIVDHVQKHSLTESMRSFERATKRLQLGEHPQFVGWRRTREQARWRSSTGGGGGGSGSSGSGSGSALNGPSALCLEGAQQALSEVRSARISECSHFEALAAVVALSTALAFAAHALRECVRRRKQTRAWRRWKRFEVRRGKGRTEVVAPVRGRRAGSGAHDGASSAGLARSLSELCLQDLGRSAEVMPDRSLSASSLHAMPDRSLSASSLSASGRACPSPKLWNRATLW